MYVCARGIKLGPATRDSMTLTAGPDLFKRFGTSLLRPSGCPYDAMRPSRDILERLLNIDIHMLYGCFVNVCF
jgi:hypothetical protein